MKKILGFLMTLFFVFFMQTTSFAEVVTQPNVSIASTHKISVSSNMFDGYIAFELSTEKINGNQQYFITISEHLQAKQPMSLLNFNFKNPTKGYFLNGNEKTVVVFTENASEINTKEKFIKFQLDNATKDKIKASKEVAFGIPLHNGAIVSFTLKPQMIEEWNQVFNTTL